MMQSGPLNHISINRVGNRLDLLSRVCTCGDRRQLIVSSGFCSMADASTSLIKQCNASAERGMCQEPDPIDLGMLFFTRQKGSSSSSRNVLEKEVPNSQHYLSSSVICECMEYQVGWGCF